MTMDRSLKTRGGLSKTRSVLKRDERIARLLDEGKFDPEKSCPMGLVKTKVRHSRAGMKSKKAAEEKAAVPAEGAPAAEAAAAPAGAKAAAGKAPAAGAKAPAAGAKAPAGKAPAGKAKG